MIAFVFRDYNMLLDAISDFYLFNDRAVDMQIWAPLTKSEFRVSDTQVTVKACGLVVSKVRLLRVYNNVTMDEELYTLGGKYIRNQTSAT